MQTAGLAALTPLSLSQQGCLMGKSCLDRGHDGEIPAARTVFIVIWCNRINRSCVLFFFLHCTRNKGGEKNTKKNGNASTMPEHCRKGRSCQVAKWKPNADHILKSPEEFFKRQKVWLNSVWACVTIWRKWQKARQNAWNWKSATCVKCGHRVMSVSVG